MSFCKGLWAFLLLRKHIFFVASFFLPNIFVATTFAKASVLDHVKSCTDLELILVATWIKEGHGILGDYGIVVETLVSCFFVFVSFLQVSFVGCSGYAVAKAGSIIAVALLYTTCHARACPNLDDFKLRFPGSSKTVTSQANLVVRIAHSPETESQRETGRC